MVTGTIEKTVDEQMKEKGHATLTMYLWEISRGTVGEVKDPYYVYANSSTVGVRYGGREFQFSIEDMVREAIEAIDAAKKS